MDDEAEKLAAEVVATFRAWLLENVPQKLSFLYLRWFLEGEEVTTLRLHVAEEPLIFPQPTGTWRSSGDLELDDAMRLVGDIVQKTLENVSAGAGAIGVFRRYSEGKSAFHIIHENNRWRYEIV